MKRPLIVGVRAPGAKHYQFRIFGHAEKRFPPAELSATLHGLAQWLAHGQPGREGEDVTAAPELRVI